MLACARCALPKASLTKTSPSAASWSAKAGSFFSSPAWKEHRLDPTRLGVTALREYLQDLLDGHIERELPKVRSEIKSLLAGTEAQLANLGDERPSTAHMRMFLTRRSMEFHGLAQSALDGNYHERDTDFFKEHHTTRLRAEVHRLNGSFATEMRENGQKRKLSVLTPSEDCSDQESDSDSEDGPLLVTQQEFNTWVKEVLAPCIESLMMNQF